jgi:hypothetical protein
MASLETNEKACVIAGVAISRFLGLRIPAVVIATADFVELKRVARGTHLRLRLRDAFPARSKKGAA